MIFFFAKRMRSYGNLTIASHNTLHFYQIDDFHIDFDENKSDLCENKTHTHRHTHQVESISGLKWKKINFTKLNSDWYMQRRNELVSIHKLLLFWSNLTAILLLHTYQYPLICYQSSSKISYNMRKYLLCFLSRSPSTCCVLIVTAKVWRKK